MLIWYVISSKLTELYYNTELSKNVTTDDGG